MKNIQLELNESNMVSIFSSENFYGTWKVFLRELLQNACDACFTRQALLWSWGTEFLEMQEVELVNSIREPYVPKITITLDTSSHTLSIEDNGIGMNEEDLLRYVAKIGGSFYASEEFARQRLAYTPVSRYGIGMCSCFMVARAMLIESKKDRAINTAWNVMNRQNLDGIMAKWFGESHEIQYVNTKRQESGTKVTLSIKAAYEKRINMNFLLDSISHYMLYQPIPITINCDNETRVLYQNKIIWKMPFVDVIGITTIQIKNELMEGYIAIYNYRHKHLIEDSELYQQNFLVTEHVETLELKPNWLEYFTFRLNLKKRMLNLTMSRVTVTEDEQLEELRKQIGLILVRHFDKNPMTLAQYLGDGKQPLLSRYEQEADLVSRAIQVRVYVKSQEIEVPIRTVIGGYMGRKIRIASISRLLFKFYMDNYVHSFKEFVAEYDLIVFDKNIQAFMQFLSPYLVSQHYIVSENAGIVYTEINADFTEKRNTSEYRKKIQLYPKSCLNSTAFCVVDNSRISPVELTINENNRNAQLLARVDHYSKVRKLRAVIMENIKRRVLGIHKFWSKIIDFGGMVIDEWENNNPLSVHSAWSLEPNFHELVNQFIAERLTPEEIAKLGLTDLKFTKEDFIAWWYPPR